MNRKKPLNYFERQKIRLHPKRYHHCFLPDYWYYCGERWRELRVRTSGWIVLMAYWAFCVGMPLYFYLDPVPILSLSDNERVIAAMAFSFAPPLVFCLLRYRKERRAALMSHYRRRQWVKGIPVWLVCSAWLPLGMFEMWLLDALEWI